MSYKSNLYDKLFICVYVFMRYIKKKRENLTIASHWLGICSAMNINTVIFSLLLLVGAKSNWAILLLIPFIFFYKYLRKHYLFSGHAVRLTENLTEEQLNSGRVWIGIIYSFLSIFLFWVVPFFVHWLKTIWAKIII